MSTSTWATIKTRADGKLGFNWSYEPEDERRRGLLATFKMLIPPQDREWSGSESTWIVNASRLPELKDFALTFDSATYIDGDATTDLRTGQTVRQPSLFG